MEVIRICEPADEFDGCTANAVQSSFLLELESWWNEKTNEVEYDKNYFVTIKSQNYPVTMDAHR
ncbi:hypothetical protein ACW6B4_000560 [Yersinia ruckeri]|uniref:hypothetical protein n=1 Tax=Yersinia ruckeri TaxID=29486 RepID=UPI000538E624|nr:hypothetical protein [Yersinia ruckeri]AUQ43103.1 hypothetical protein NJ56_15035 [Yersinia ruckeri]WMS04792.1 hypothetical protein RDY86_12785 [Yersinia ruckeri]